MELQAPEQLPLEARNGLQDPLQASGVIPDTEEVSPPTAWEPVHCQAPTATAAPADAAAVAGGGVEVAEQGQPAPSAVQQGEGRVNADVAGAEQPWEGQGMEGLEEQGRSDVECTFQDDKVADLTRELSRSKAASVPAAGVDERWML